jgi:2-methylisocitrate lyase-like PEP mutase family enzyme
MSRASVLRALLADTKTKPLIAPGGGTPLEALAVEKAGFDAFYLSGYAIAAWRHGLPDIGLLGALDTAEALSAITRVTSIPIICDADTGYGDEASVHSTVRLLEAAGASAIQLEDQAWPKKCGHMSDKTVIDAGDAARKIEAAVAARRNPDTVIIARTDSLGPLGVDEAIRRVKMFGEAGADMLFVDAPQSIEHLKMISSQVDGLLMANMSESGLTPAMSASEFHALGYGFVAFPTTALRVAARSMDNLFSVLKETEDTRSLRDQMFGLDELNDLVKLDEYNQIGQK